MYENVQFITLYYVELSVKILQNDEFQFFKIVFILANSANPDEMPHYAVFHASLHYLNLYPDLKRLTG